MDSLSLDEFRPEAIEGFLTLSYTDSNTDKIKEQIKGKNHVFKHPFTAPQIWDVLHQTTAPCLFLTDDNTPINDDFQFLRGNVIGWGQRNAGTSGQFQGAWSAVNGYIAKRIFDPFALEFNYEFDWLPTQVPDDVKSVGLTQQYHMAGASVPNSQGYITGNVNELGLPLRRLGRPTLPTSGDGLAFKGKVYSVTTAGVVSILDTISGESTSVNISSVVGTVSITCIGASDDGKMYISTWSNTASLRRLFVFSDDTFSNLENTYPITNLDQYSTNFAVFGNTMYYYIRLLPLKLMKLNFTNGSVSVQLNVPTDRYVNNLNLSPSGQVGNFAVSLIGTRFMNTTTTRAGNSIYPATASEARRVIWDIEKDKYLGWTLTLDSGVNYSGSSSNTSPGYCIESPFSGSGGVLFTNGWAPELFIKQAICGYTIPDDAPQRPPGTGINVSYKIRMLYQ